MSNDTGLSSRQISHIVPRDGTEHEMAECYCHPEIHETNAVAATMGLDEAGVKDDVSGALTFVHRSASSTAEWDIGYETDD